MPDSGELLANDQCCQLKKIDIKLYKNKKGFDIIMAGVPYVIPKNKSEYR